MLWIRLRIRAKFSSSKALAVLYPMYPYFPIEVYKIEKYKYTCRYITLIYPRVRKKGIYGYEGYATRAALQIRGTWRAKFKVRKVKKV